MQGSSVTSIPFFAGRCLQTGSHAIHQLTHDAHGWIQVSPCAVPHQPPPFLLAHSLESISRDFLLNEFKLKSGFRKLFDTTVFGFIHELRMNHALELIQAGGCSAADISIVVGYESETSFRRAFKLFFGISPTMLKRN